MRRALALLLVILVAAACVAVASKLIGKGTDTIEHPAPMSTPGVVLWTPSR